MRSILKRYLPVLLLLSLLPRMPARAEDAPIRLTAAHIPYLDPAEDGRFRPGEALARGEAAAWIYRLLEEKPSVPPTEFADLPPQSLEGKAAAALCALGLMEADEAGCFRPEAPMGRMDFLGLLRGCIPTLPEPEEADTDALTRIDAVQLLNRALGRSAAHPDSLALLRDAGAWLFTDVPPDSRCFPAVMEAALPHSLRRADGGEIWTGLTLRGCGCAAGVRAIGGVLCRIDERGQLSGRLGGLWRVNGRLYLADEQGRLPEPGPLEAEGKLRYVFSDGRLAADCTVGYLTFDADGAYTSGNAELDTLVEQTLAEAVTPGEDRETQLREVYLHLRDSYRYLGRPHLERGAVGWEEEQALFFLTNGKGNCYSYAAAFQYLARRLGYQAHCISGGIGRKNDDHAWVMIGELLYDVEIEYAYRYRYETRRFFDLYGKTRAEMPFTYVYPD